MASPTLTARMRRSLAYRGAGRTLRVAVALAGYRLRRGFRAPRPHAFDLEFGTETASLAQASRYQGAGEGGNGHEPIDTVDFANLIAPLAGVIAGGGFTFLDFGSGQGRALLLASDYPFARIVGVEHGLELHQSAERNLARYRSRRQRCPAIESLWADATTWELPLEPTVFYFCEPFQEPLLRRMAERVRASLGAHPRAGYVLYVGSLAAVWEASGAFATLAAGCESRVYRWRGSGN
ncbi:MAG TPA: hypothetical protein VNF74_10795 [Terriglobales bacterium]|nr:hypothetical protein [Terriglobales bacterium]